MIEEQIVREDGRKVQAEGEQVMHVGQQRSPTLPDIISVCTSPEFLPNDFATELLAVIQATKSGNRKERPNNDLQEDWEEASCR